METVIGKMAALFPKLIAILGALALSACVAGGPGAGAGGKAAGPNPVTGGAIEVTALDAPASKPMAVKPGAAGAKPADPAPPAQTNPPADPAAKPETRPEQTEDAAAVAEPVPPVPEVEKIAAQLQCEKRGNIWSRAGKSGAYACVKRLTDGGKRCTSGTQCQGDCLARSNTCAPLAPLFGCNEILQDNGGRVTLCLD